MKCRGGLFRSTITVAAVIAASNSPLASCEKDSSSPRRLEIMVTNEDEYAEAVLTADVSKTFGIGLHDHERILATLKTTREMIDTARVLIDDGDADGEGMQQMQQANTLFQKVKNHITQMREEYDARAKQIGERDLLRKKFSDHDARKTQEDEERLLDVSRKIYEMMITFPDCIEKLFEECLEIINGDLESLGLATIEVIVREKRNINQDGYNKVVIITNELADRVKGRAGDGLISYPYLWNDASQGQRVLGVDGKWNCHDLTPDSCCDIVKQSVPNPDIRGNYIECHIFVPFGGVGNPRRNDRVFIILSPDGRVHEAPIIQ